jgi:hypothetical protein
MSALASSLIGSAKTEESLGPPWLATRAALALAMGCLTLIRGHLHIPGDGRDQFCPLTAVETGRGRRSTGRQLSRFLKTMGAASGVALAPVMVSSMGGPPSSGGLTRKVLIQRGDSASSGDYGG